MDVPPPPMAATPRDGPSPPSGPRRIRAVVVDDHGLIREGTVELLSHTADIQVVGQADTAERALAVIAAESPDVVLADISLPGANGIEMARMIRLDHPGTAILIVTAYDDSAYVAAALDIGVDGYILKTVSGSELADAVRAVADGVFVLDHALSRRLGRHWGGAGSTDGRNEALTGREAEVVELLAAGCLNKEIASHLGLSVRTVEAHVSKVMSKLNLGSRTQVVRYALDHHLVADDGSRLRR